MRRSASLITVRAANHYRDEPEERFDCFMVEDQAYSQELNLKNHPYHRPSFEEQPAPRTNPQRQVLRAILRTESLQTRIGSVLFFTRSPKTPVGSGPEIKSTGRRFYTKIIECFRSVPSMNGDALSAPGPL